MGRQTVARIDAALVGYENQENLGLRSIMACLLAKGYKAELIPFSPDREADVLNLVLKLDPALIGFSLIFQYSLDEFGRLMCFLRDHGVQSHFTAGGHYPSLCPDKALELLPQLDSIVRFEGELTLSELLDQLDHRERWKDIRGLAFRQGSEIITTPLRPLIADLDSLPTVFRSKPREGVYGIRMSSMLASRGCLFNCSFCSIRQFYGATSGALRRVRSPQAVVSEMRTLFNESGVRFFSFQDDDFASRTPQQQGWLREFLRELDNENLSPHIQWKISCRVDDVEPEFLEEMINHGLLAVYLGVESGSPTGLRTMNKRVTVTQNLRAIELLEQSNLILAMGFMLFDPSSTMDTVRENISFLRSVGETGYFPVNFCKMLPYAGTPIERQLREEKRLKGTITCPDYDFHDDRLNWYAFFVQRIFTRRNFHSEGLVARQQQADFDYRLSEACGLGEKLPEFGMALRNLIRKSNNQAIDTLAALWDEVVARGAESLIEEQGTLTELAEKEWSCEALVEAELDLVSEGSLSARQ